MEVIRDLINRSLREGRNCRERIDTKSRRNNGSVANHQALMDLTFSALEQLAFVVHAAAGASSVVADTSTTTGQVLARTPSLHKMGSPYMA